MHVARLMFTAYASQHALPGKAHNGNKGLQFCILITLSISFFLMLLSEVEAGF